MSDAEVERFLSDVEGGPSAGLPPFGRKRKRTFRLGFPEKSRFPTTELINDSPGQGGGEVHWARRVGESGELWKVTNFMANKFLNKGPNAFRKKSVFTLQAG